VPIHDQSYRRQSGPRGVARSPWLVIAVTGILTLVRRRVFVALLLFAWLVFLVHAVRIYIAATFPAAGPLLAMTAASFRQFFDHQAIFVFFVTVYVGAGLIAGDRQAHALQIYLSKPLTRVEYVAGKMAILVFFLLLVTWLPAMLLLLLQALFAGSFAFARENLFLVPAVTVFSIVQALAAAFSMLALSSLSTSSRFVAVLYAGLVLFTRALFEAMRGITGTSAASWLSFTASLEQVGDVVFRQRARYDTPGVVSFLVVIALMVLAAAVLERRVRGTEVVT
jgi:ABC-2 type transport system permease protein